MSDPSRKNKKKSVKERGIIVRPHSGNVLRTVAISSKVSNRYLDQRDCGGKCTVHVTRLARFKSVVGSLLYTFYVL
jgi:hypothetical protein